MDKELLFKRKAVLESASVELDADTTVIVRALTRGEVNDCRKGKPAPDLYERRLIAMAMVDPVMTLEEVSLWLDGDPDDDDDFGAPAGDSVKITEEVARLSGLTEQGAQKRVPPVRRRPRR